VRRNAAGAAKAFGWTFPFTRAAHAGAGRARNRAGDPRRNRHSDRRRTLPEAAPARKRRFHSALPLAENTTAPHRILALGPLTNIAALALARPILPPASPNSPGWAAASRGNHTASAEFNALADPEAGAIVIAHGLPLRMVDLDFCRKVLASPEDIEPIRNAGGANAAMLADMLAGYIDIGTAVAAPPWQSTIPPPPSPSSAPDLVTFRPRGSTSSCRAADARPHRGRNPRQPCRFNAEFAADCRRRDGKAP
jgi:purine nucleosidase